MKKIEAKAQAVLDARKEFEGSTLADLYDPNTTPPKLTKAHKALDKAVEIFYYKLLDLSHQTILYSNISEKVQSGGKSSYVTTNL